MKKRPSAFPALQPGETIVVALGGNAIMDKKGRAPYEVQRAATRATMASVASLIESGYRMVLTHGNGPIVGNILIRNEAAADQIPPMPLEVCVADSCGGLGYMIQQSLKNELIVLGCDQEVVTIISQLEVSRDDPAFRKPTKPIGPFYTEAEAKAYEANAGWHVKEDSGRGWRRLVASPRPRSIVERDTIRTLVQAGAVVIAVGGGGIPVYRREDGTLEGLDAVIDKDWAALLLARDVGARHIALLTGVEKVALHFGSDNQVDLDRITVEEAQSFLDADEFPAGSMGPKIEASIDFLTGGGDGVLITCPDCLDAGLRGETGTWIMNDEAATG